MSSDGKEYDDLLDDSFDYEEEDYEDLDFGDEDGLDDGMSALDDDFDDGFGDDEAFDEAGSGAQQEKKKFSLNFNTIVIIGAVIFGGLIMMYQVSSNKPDAVAPSQEKFASALQMQGNFDGPGSIDAVEENAGSNKGKTDEAKSDDGGGFLFDTGSLDVAQEIASSVEDASDKVVVQSNEANIDLNLMAEPEPEKIILPSEDKIELPVEVATISEPVTTLSDGAFDIVETIEPDNIVEAIEIEETVELVSPEPVIVFADQNVSSSNVVEEVFAEEIPVVEATTIMSSDNQEAEALRARLDAMQRELSNTRTQYQKTINSLESQVASLKQNKSSSRSPARAVKQNSVRRSASSGGAWELRAAQPGRAWVSKKGQKEMRPIVVGDKLPGLGRVQNITYQNQKWVVLGSEGKITQ